MRAAISKLTAGCKFRFLAADNSAAEAALRSRRTAWGTNCRVAQAAWLGRKAMGNHRQGHFSVRARQLTSQATEGRSSGARRTRHHGCPAAANDRRAVRRAAHKTTNMTDNSLMRSMKNLFIGRERTLTDNSLFHKLSLVALLAWVGLGADGLSSSCYGPEEAYKVLLAHPPLALFVALMSAATVAIICVSYSQIIALFLRWRGYLVASRLLSPTAGVVSGSALLIDYVLTISVSVASGMDALFSFLPVAWLAGNLRPRWVALSSSRCSICGACANRCCSWSCFRAVSDHPQFCGALCFWRARRRPVDARG